ncbi:MAG: polymer-forming cytoskeletal protein [Bacteroidales bacterium]|nr:polymer-forming cytoskeletal protein [Lachnoclostridium sp.]MCM1383657.1 polymer-forming cytoskeletal protein [Lachnoclostridium sp.]MCM1466287.1 polymer-forming cytoskeletal protein [Bacteroidales bacterium]
MLGKKDAEIKITTLVGSDAQLNGDFASGGSVRVDGKITGNVTVEKTLILGVTGSITGDVKAENVMIGGEILGDITITNKTELLETAKVVGDISTNLIVIDENAIFQGGCNMNRDIPEKRKEDAKTLRENRKSADAAMAEALSGNQGQAVSET